MSIATAGPLATEHSSKKITNSAQAVALGAEEAERMDTGFRFDADAAHALARVCSAEFTFARPSQREKFIEEFARVTISKSLGRLYGTQDYAVAVHAAQIARSDAARAFARMDAQYFLANHDAVTWATARMLGAIYAHAYTWANRLLIEEYIREFVMSARAK